MTDGQKKNSISPLRKLFNRVATPLILTFSAGCQSLPTTVPIFPRNEIPPTQGAPLGGVYNPIAAVRNIDWNDPKWAPEWSVPENRDSQLRFSYTEWRACMSRHVAEMKDPATAKLVNDWMADLTSYCGGNAPPQNPSLAALAALVDRYADEYITYTPDSELYKKGEYFATPAETIRNKKGDCEDYAILKYYAMRHLGVPEEKLHLMLVSTIKDKPLDHGVLAVDTETRPGRAPSFRVLSNDSFFFGQGWAMMPQTTGYTPYLAFSESRTLVYMPPASLKPPAPDETQERGFTPRSVGESPERPSKPVPKPLLGP